MIKIDFETMGENENTPKKVCMVKRRKGCHTMAFSDP